MKKLILVSLIAPLLYGDILAQPVPDAVVIPQNTRFGQRFIPERRSSDRQTSQSGTGAIWFNTTEQQWKGDTGVSIVPIGQGGGGGQSPGPQSPNTVQAGPVSGGAANPTFRQLVSADIPLLDASKIGTGLIPTARGGTGIGNFAVGDLLYANTTSTLARLALGTAGQCLIVSGGLPIWSACPGSGGGAGITSLNGLSASSQTFANDTNVIISSSGSTHTLGWSGLLGINRGGTNSNTSQGAINNLSQLTTQGDILYHNGLNSTRLPRGTTGQCLASTLTGIQWQACAGGVSTITSGNLSPLFTVSIANPSTTPDITFTAISQSQNLFYGSPSGSSGNPSFRALVALDIPSLDTSKITSGVFAAARIPNLSTIPTGLTPSRCLQTDASGFPTIHTGPCGSGTVTGTGTTNTVPKWTSSTALGDSGLTDNGTDLTYGTGGNGTVRFGKVELSGSAGVAGECLKSGGTAGVNSWGACGTGGGGTFTDITTGTNTVAAMVVGSGASLNYTGTGSINAKTVEGNTVAKVYLGKTADPTASDNAAAGYANGDEWIRSNITPNKVWRKTNESGGVAVWIDISATGGLTDGDKGDITVGSSGTTLTIDSAAVTAAKTAADLKARTCEIVYGSRTSGATAIASDDDVTEICSNLTGSTMTIVSVECRANTSDMSVRPVVSGGAVDSILSSSLTCGNGSFASGSLNGTPTQSNGVTLDFNVNTGGTATYAVVRVKRTL